MTSGRGRITSAPQRRLRLMIGAQVFWLAIVCLLGGVVVSARAQSGFAHRGA